ncbi:MAG: helix-turn-helix transcriptional regulator [Bacillota bacterium]
MDLLRIGEKMISRERIHKAIDRILELRERGLSQQEVANKVKIDRTFISRLEGLGEIRKGGPIAVIGFPLANCAELEEVAQEEGVDYILLMNDEQRWGFVTERSGIELFNEVMAIIARLRDFSTIILLGSDKRVHLFEALLDAEVVSITLGESPIIGDRHFDPEELRQIIRSFKNKEG